MTLADLPPPHFFLFFEPSLIAFFSFVFLLSIFFIFVLFYLREGFKKIKKKYGFIPIWMGGRVRMGTISIKKQKKHAFKIHSRPF